MIVRCQVSMTHSEKLQKCLKAKDTVEIVTDRQEVTGKLSEVGEDYIAIISARESEITTPIMISGTDKTEDQKSIQVTEFETIILLKDIHAVSRILRQVIK